MLVFYAAGTHPSSGGFPTIATRGHPRTVRSAATKLKQQKQNKKNMGPKRSASPQADYGGHRREAARRSTRPHAPRTHTRTDAHTHTHAARLESLPPQTTHATRRKGQRAGLTDTHTQTRRRSVGSIYAHARTDSHIRANFLKRPRRDMFVRSRTALAPNEPK